jgi:hypothetical protein
MVLALKLMCPGRIQSTVSELEKTAPAKKCKVVAKGLAALPEAFIAGGTQLKDVLTQIHGDGSSCLAPLLRDWSSRDAYCRSGVSQGISSRAGMRVLMVLLQYYGSYYDGKETISADHRRDLDAENDGTRRAASTKMPPVESFCLYQVSEFLKAGGNLFDTGKCEGKHPIWSDMGPDGGSCPATCWEHMEKQINGNGCVALYYDAQFEMFYTPGRDTDKDEPTATKRSVEEVVGQMTAAQKPEIDSKCKGQDKTAPCTGIDAAIASCAKAAGVKEPYSKYLSQVRARGRYKGQRALHPVPDT